MSSKLKIIDKKNITKYNCIIIPNQPSKPIVPKTVKPPPTKVVKNNKITVKNNKEKN